MGIEAWEEAGERRDPELVEAVADRAGVREDRLRPVPSATQVTPADTVGGGPSSRAWLGVFALAVGAAIIVTTEFLPVGFLPNVASDLHLSLGVAGLMILVPGLSAGIAAPLAIVAARGLDRRRMIVALGLLVAASNVVAAVAPDFAVLLVGRVLLGAAIGGFWGVVPPLGARLTDPQRATRATSIILTGLSAGTVIGLPAGQFFGHLVGWRATFAATAGLALVIAVAQRLVLPALPAASGSMRFSQLARVFRVPIARTTLLAGGLATIGQFAASTYMTPLLLQKVHLSSGVASLLFVGYGVAGIFGTLIGAAFVARSRIATFVGAALAYGIVLAVLPLVTGLPVLAGVLIVVWGLIWGLVPLALQMLMLTATPDAPEVSAAVLMSMLQFGIAGGSALGGILVDSAGLRTVFFVAGAAAALGGVVALLSRATVAHVSSSPAPDSVPDSVHQG
jgi:predicted MFS family arabinose efflux permease